MSEKIFDFSKVKQSKNITKEEIFNNYDQLSIFEKYFGSSINLKKNYKNRLRADRSAGCKFTYKDNILYFNDYAKSKRYNVIQWVMEDFNVSYFEAINKIRDEFCIDFIPNNKKNIELENFVKNSEIKIQITPKEYSQKFIEYYKQYHIDPEDCKQENVYCVDELFFNGEKFYISDKELCIAYYFPEIDKIKILRPEQPKQSKWRTNVPNTYLDGLSEITNEVKYVIIVKSKKEKILLKKLGYKNVISTQMEGKFVITEESEKKLEDFYKIIWMDSDPTGVEVSNFYEQRGYIPAKFEPIYFQQFGITDPSDYVKAFNESTKIKEILNKIIDKI